MTAPDLQNQRCAVVGAGKSGLSAARLLLEMGARVLLLDERAVTAELPKSGPFEARLGQPGFRFDDCTLAVISPGVPWNHPDLVAARAGGLRMVAEVELAFWYLEAPLAAVTGTNGKSTTTALLGEILRADDRNPFVGGNLGVPLTSAVGGDHDCLAVELSSFQLEGIDTFHAQAAAILNVTPDHLDRYPDLDAYAAAKGRLFERQRPGDTAVLNVDDAFFAPLARKVRGRLRTFGARANARPVAGGFAVEGRTYRLANRALRGQHNLSNAMAAALLAQGMDASDKAIQTGLDRFPGLPHRLELVREHEGVEWLNDSKATNIESTLVALHAIPGPLIWIAGGRGKGAPYTPLKPLLGKRLLRALLIGEDASAIAKALPEHAEQVGTLEAAVARAATLAEVGDTVLLSPACASYDQFKNYEERGERFRALVEAL